MEIQRVRKHYYDITVTWNGNHGTGTSGYTEYGRDHTIQSDGKVALSCSADPNFRGDPAKWNPEELLVASVANCHLLWYLHLCADADADADAGVIVQAYEDSAQGILSMNSDGSGAFSEIALRPRVTIADGSDAELARTLHQRAHEMCFIARSLSCPVPYEPIIVQE